MYLWTKRMWRIWLIYPFGFVRPICPFYPSYSSYSRNCYFTFGWNPSDPVVIVTLSSIEESCPCAQHTHTLWAHVKFVYQKSYGPLKYCFIVQFFGVIPQFYRVSFSIEKRRGVVPSDDSRPATDRNLSWMNLFHSQNVTWSSHNLDFLGF